MGHVGSKTGSLGQILEKPCVRSRGHSFSLIIMKPDQNVCLNEILEDFENGLCQVKHGVTRSNLRKPCIRSIGHIFIPIIVKTSQNLCLDKVSKELENGLCWIKN